MVLMTEMEYSGPSGRDGREGLQEEKRDSGITGPPGMASQGTVAVD